MAVLLLTFEYNLSYIIYCRRYILCRSLVQTEVYIPIHVGLVLQLPLAKQDTEGDPDRRMYPLLQVYTVML